MSIVEKLKHAITNDDMSIVCECYNEMTGEKIKYAKKQQGKRNITAIELIEELRNIINSYESIETETETETEVQEENLPLPKKRGRKPKPRVVETKSLVNVDGDSVISIIDHEGNVVTTAIGNKKMKFVSSEFDQKEHDVSEKISKMSNSSRPHYVSKTCSVCNKEEGQPVLKDDATVYICNSCLISKKKG
jgi:hypothetical protein